MTIRILCYGDSNTWGYIPGSDNLRYSEKERYPLLLQGLLGVDYELLEEGLNGRTLTSTDARPGNEGREGHKTLFPIIQKHMPLELIILMLGTNELKNIFHNRPHEIGRMLEGYFVKPLIQQGLRILIVSPPLVDETKENCSEVYEGARDKSKELASIYSEIAQKHSCIFVDGSTLEVGSDGVHLTKNGHYALANMIYDRMSKFSF